MRAMAVREAAVQRMGRWRAAPPTGGWSGGRAAPCAARAPRPARPPTRCSAIWPRPVSTARRGCSPPTRRTETLSYIDGWAAVPPLPEDMLTERALISVAELLRRYHQAVASFDPAGYRWPRPVPARFAGPLVSHNDVHPANVIFRGGRAVALIDFDLAGPGSPAWDLAAAARHWSPLYDERDVRRLAAGPGAAPVPAAAGRLRAARRRAARGGRGDPGQPRLELRHHHRRGAVRPSRLHRLLAAGGGPDDPGPPLVRDSPARPAGRGQVTAGP